MQKYQPLIPSRFDYLFDDIRDKLFTEYLTNYILFDIEIETTPTLWQDAEIYIRFLKRDVWSLSKEQQNNSEFAFLVYQTKYIIDHFKKAEILEVLNLFFAQIPDDHKTLIKLFENKLHAPLKSLIITQEKFTITKEKAKNFDVVFKYPCWVDFTDEANAIIFKRILNNKLTDEQIDYFLGASDNISHYDQWFKVVKHVLKTTNNSHVFWTAGDILSIIWKAMPKDAKSEKWFKDQVFEIFWPRVKSVWPLLNEDKIDFDKNETSKILKDSISWLRVLDDLKERLPELGDDYQLFEHDTDATDFKKTKNELLKKTETITKTEDSTKRIDLTLDAVNLFFTLTSFAYDKTSVTTLHQIAEEKLIPIVKESKYNQYETIIMIKRAIKHAENYLKTLAREQKNLSKLLA